MAGQTLADWQKDEVKRKPECTRPLTTGVPKGEPVAGRSSKEERNSCQWTERGKDYFSLISKTSSLCVKKRCLRAVPMRFLRVNAVFLFSAYSSDWQP